MLANIRATMLAGNAVYSAGLFNCIHWAFLQRLEARDIDKFFKSSAKVTMRGFVTWFLGFTLVAQLLLTFQMLHIAYVQGIFGAQPRNVGRPERAV